MGRNLVAWRGRSIRESARRGLIARRGRRQFGDHGRRAMIAAGVVSCFCMAPAVAPSIAQATPCSTANPASNYSGGYPGQGETIAQTQEKFDAMRKAEGCNEPMVLPANYLSMTEQEQFFTLYNLEREARGLAPLKLDSTLLSQISFNHSKEIATYEYFTHQSPINRPENSPVFGRFTVNPVFKEITGWGETGVFGINNGECETETGEKIKCELKIPAANFIAAFMYGDGPGENANPACKGAVTTGCWGHRDTILGNFNWIGIGVSPREPVTSDFALLPANYTPPATADTNPPEIGAVSYANGTATATGVKDSPLNKNDTGEKPLTAGITQVVFYVNKIVYPEENGNYNTVEATETPAGSKTWTAPITVKEGETLHAVAVDGSGNFTDETIKASPPPNPTGGSWLNTVGHEGYDLAAWDSSSDVSDMPGVSVNLEKGSRYEWTPATGDTRALQSPDGLTRAAATYYDLNEIKLGLTFSKAFTGNLHLYALDWETTERREVITVAGKATTLSGSFKEGAWVTVPISVKAGETVPITVEHTGGKNAVLSGIFLGDAGAPPAIASETKPEGKWTEAVGHEGYALAAWDSSSDVSDLPGASLSLTQGARYLWSSSTSDARALQSPDGLTREAGTYYGSQIRLALKFKSAFTGNIHLYAVDWDGSARRELISVGGQTADLNASFNAGAWVSFPISVKAGEEVPIVVDSRAGSNAVLSGIFLGDAGAPPAIASETKPEGSWVGTYGSKGFDLAAWNNSTDLVEMPSAEVSLTQGSRYQWAASTTDVRALQNPEKTTREAATYYGSQIRLTLKFKSAFTGNVHLYAVDWETTARRELISVGGQTADLNASFNAGAWVSIPISVGAGEEVPIVVDRQAGTNAVLSGIFLE
jgi:hypothetical protein